MEQLVVAFIFSRFLAEGQTACPIRGVSEFQMPSTSQTSVKTDDPEVTRGKVTLTH